MEKKIIIRERAEGGTEFAVTDMKGKRHWFHTDARNRGLWALGAEGWVCVMAPTDFYLTGKYDTDYHKIMRKFYINNY